MQQTEMMKKADVLRRESAIAIALISSPRSFKARCIRQSQEAGCFVGVYERSARRRIEGQHELIHSREPYHTTSRAVLSTRS